MLFTFLTMNYTKDALSTEQHIALLNLRALSIDNIERAAHYLNSIGYYRLTGYMYHLQQADGSHQFKPDISFNDVVDHYKFDGKLRLLTLEYLERIEVSLRAKLTDAHCLATNDFFWYTKADSYANQHTLAMITEEVRERFEDAHELFIRKFKSKYTSERMPPSNMALELLSFGKLTHLFEGINNNHPKTAIAQSYGLPSTVLSSWFKYLAGVRNICAHHGRLWNRGITANRPVIPKRAAYRFHGSINDKFDRSYYGVAAIVDKLLGSFNPDNSYVARLTALIDQYPVINTSYMGFPVDWRENAVWLNR